MSDEPIPSPAEAAAADNPSWNRVLLARHPKRPHSRDYIDRLITNFEELKGDSFFADDASILAGMGDFEGQPIMVIGQQKGRDTKQKLLHNFGMPKPEGYRKALRLMQLAAKFRRPILTLIDTPGAYPGIDAEERGQAEAIAHKSARDVEASDRDCKCCDWRRREWRSTRYWRCEPSVHA